MLKTMPRSLSSGLLFTSFLLILLGAIVTGCARTSHQSGGLASDDGMQMTLAVTPDPPAVGEATLTITLRDANGDTIEGANLAMKGDMSHAGMTAVIANTSQSNQGVYTVPLTWTMAGDWTISIVATLPDGNIVTRRFDLTVASDMR
ncbi:MAG: FixH family protein [Chloroflexi bacterium]|nr:FixH family protein [Chloroflexota bacterium]